VIQALFPQASVVRVMPNVALMVGAGMSVVAGAAGTPDAEVELTCELFSCMGEAVAIEEDLIDAATAVSGSGPAYFALLARELSRAGSRAGLDPELAALLSRQTLVGASRYLDDTGLQPDHLMGAVTSPGGTTQAALQSLEQSGFPAAVSAAVTAAIARAKELA
jgi:pyrroline-5-carboxylate reductase